MKLLGISAGRKLGNSEILLKEALMAAEETGDTIDVEIVRLCDIRGDLRIERDEIKITWREEDLKKIRWEPVGMGHHFGEIKENHAHFEQNKELVKQRLEKYRNYKTYSRP